MRFRIFAAAGRRRSVGRLATGASILLTVLLVGGCATDGRAMALNDTLEAYRKTIRWEAPLTAAQFLHPEERPAERQLGFQINRLEQFQVTIYQAMGPGSFSADGDFVQTIQINLINRHTMREKVLQDRQVWRWDEERERWWLTSGLPDPAKAR
ncbi:MAG: hypothetical protein AAGB27_13805 [Pseudomonadota bacterium]